METKTKPVNFPDKGISIIMPDNTNSGDPDDFASETIKNMQNISYKITTFR